jgi:CHAT domain-containing protein/tetratricopeptide (TPR) repeat protein
MPRLSSPALLGASVVVTALVLVSWRAGWRDGSARDDISILASTVGGSLPFDARLAGGFAPPTRRKVRGPESPPSSPLPPDARIVLALIEKRAAAQPSSKARVDLGVAYLVQGDVDRAVELLESSAPVVDDARSWNDLSAAYLVKGDRAPSRRVEYFARSLQAAATSLSRSPTAEARFNRALAIESLTPFMAPASPWADVLDHERDERWSEVARGRRQTPVSGGVSAAEQWQALKPKLIDALRTGDVAFAREAVGRFPEAALEFFDRELLVAWAGGDTRALDQAATLAAALHSATGDSIPATEVALIKKTGSALRSAHAAYSAGALKVDADNLMNALEPLARAREQFARLGSPYALWATVYEATIAFQQRRLDEADRQLGEVERAATAARYRTLLGRTLWLRGLVYSKQWRLNEALKAFRAGAAIYEDSHQLEHAISLYGYLADVLRTLGEDHESWEYIGRILEGLPRMRKPLRRYLFLYNASLFASNQDLLEPALLFQNAALREAERVGNGPAMEALTQRAAIYVRRGEFDRARADLGEAWRLIGVEPNENRKRWALAEYAMVAAGASVGDSFSKVDGLRQAIAYFSRVEPSMIPRLQLGLGRALRTAGNLAAAGEALRGGIEKLEEQQSRLDDETLKVSYFDEAWNLFPEMIDLQLNGLKNDAEAFAYAERSRARSLLAVVRAGQATPPARLPEIQAALPESAVLLYFVTLPERLETWTITRAAARRVEQTIRRSELAQLVSRHRDAMMAGRDDRAAAEQLYDWLIRPATGAISSGSTLVIVPDGDLQRLPFATLRDRRTGRFFVEERALAVSPSAAFFALGADRLRHQPTRSKRTALLVGTALQGAAAEVSESARFYENPSILTGTAATKAQFLDRAPGYDVVHFGGHALMNADYPLLSRLAFAADPASDPDPLFAYEVSRLRFSATELVILAACSTAAGALSRGEGVMSLARPFLAAGVPTVIASQWDVDDRATEHLFVAFHRAFSKSGNPLESLRTAQIEALHSGDAVLSSPAGWGAFVVLGAVTQ